MNSHELKLSYLIDRLNDAINRRDSHEILSVYDDHKEQEIDEEMVAEYLYEDFSRLVDEANEILGI